MKEYIVKVKEDRTCWFNLEGQRHRENGPAVEYSNGDKSWWMNGKRHREDGPAVEWPDGSKFWYLNAKLHRENGPAIELVDGSKAWYQNGKPHREDGPAIERPDGSKEWWLNNELLTEQEFNGMISQKGINNKIVEIDGKKYKLTEI